MGHVEVQRTRSLLRREIGFPELTFTKLDLPRLLTGKLPQYLPQQTSSHQELLPFFRVQKPLAAP